LRHSDSFRSGPYEMGYPLSTVLTLAFAQAGYTILQSEVHSPSSLCDRIK